MTVQERVQTRMQEGMPERAPQRELPRHFARYVALGDSSTEGLMDPDGAGGFRGWANRLAEHIAEAQGSLLYANLAIRGRRMRQVLDEQLPPALAMAPNLATVFAGTNDLLARDFDPTAVAADMAEMQQRLVAAGATVLTFTLPDLTPVMPLARRLGPHLRVLNDALREVAARSGALLVDVAAYPVASDPRLWNEDRLHANPAGHQRIAAALARALDLPGTDDAWREPLPQLPPSSVGQRVAEEIRWVRRYMVPWVWRHFWGRSSGDGRLPKRPQLQELRVERTP